jgi:FAD/FMN-containing dehydrogenase
MEDGIVYSYLEHDGARHSVQELNDTALDLRLRVTFAAEADAKWTLRVEGTSLSGTARPETSTVSMMHYVVASERSTLEFDDEQRTVAFLSTYFLRWC